MGNWGRSHSPRLSFGPCRYRCLVALKHNLPANGDMCVSVLSRLCTVMPNMYRVGVSKVSLTPHSAPAGPKLKDSRTGACGFRNAQARVYCPRSSPVELGKWNANPASRPLFRQFPLSNSSSSFLPKPNPSSTQLQQAALSILSPWILEREGDPRPVTWPLLATLLIFYPQLFLKEHLHQLLESMREHVLNLAALTLQRCLRGFFIQRRFRSLRRKIILLQSRARGYLARCSPDRQDSLDPYG